MRMLGVYFSNGLLSVDKDNWKSKLDKLKSVLNLWSSRELSFIGRAMILNVLHASRYGCLSSLFGVLQLQQYRLAFYLERKNGMY